MPLQSHAKVWQILKAVDFLHSHNVGQAPEYAAYALYFCFVFADSLESV